MLVTRCLLLLFIALTFPVFAQQSAPDTVGSDMKILSRDMGQFAVKVYSAMDPERSENLMTGSGQLVRGTDGVVRILTNHHVVGEKAEVVWVQFDGMQSAQKVRVRGKDRLTDLALLDAPSPLPVRAKPIKLGKFSDIAIGDRVYAVGYPAGNRTISVGWVNALTTPHEDMGIGIYFTHQSPISPGSSGGSLVKMSAQGEMELVGINTQVAVNAGKLVSNLGFSIRPDVIYRIMAKLEREQVLLHAFAGFIATDTMRAHPFEYEAITKSAYPPTRNEVIVRHSVPGLPAFRAGLSAGDLIRKLEIFADDRWQQIPFSGASALRDEFFFSIPPRSRIRLTTMRGSQEVLREFVPEEYPEQPKQKME